MEARELEHAHTEPSDVPNQIYAYVPQDWIDAFRAHTDLPVDLMFRPLEPTTLDPPGATFKDIYRRFRLDRLELGALKRR